MLEQILYNEIPVRHIEKSAAWFQEVLGLKLAWHMPEEALAQLNLPSGQMLFLVETADDTQANFTKNGETHNVIGFQTRDIEKLYTHLKEHNVTVESIVDDGVGNKFLNFFDPDGNKFNVQCDA
ncbi:VOC family protein [Paenibacillus campinasensis]|uniref:Glyoxalase/bleomycin resistance/dioxygenase family protein n=1 Tax=Paenibacillus campinasensis TaxID=66347 RepID=A0A268ETL0_9BACL|nr:VOC family protein [Paenibacillus campinasensis]PAD76468.1 glyoxalase/bleomycin resistance/dioxygenase family protein [Paenibacillus campinasensis]